MNLDFLILFFFATLAKATINKSSIRRFDIDHETENTLKEYGQVADIEYDIVLDHQKHLNTKLWLQINTNAKNPKRSMLTVVRLDNVDEREGELMDHSYDQDIIDDTVWREYRGWPKTLTVKIKGHRTIKIPQNPFFDSLQMEIQSDNYEVAPAIEKNHSLPRIIHQIGADFKNQPLMKVVQKANLLTRLKNPSWSHRVLSMEEMPDLIEQLEGPTVRRAFETLKPMAFKADLYRYVVLYHYGGIYMDSKLVPRTPFDKLLMEAGGRSFMSIDLPCSEEAIQIAFMGMLPKDPLMRMAIDQIVDNVNRKFYGECALDITGPKMLGILFKELYDVEAEQYWMEPVLKDMFFILTKQRVDVIFHNGEYRRMQKFSSVPHYSDLWADNDVYNMDINFHSSATTTNQNSEGKTELQMNIINRVDVLVLVEEEIVTFE